MQTTSETHNHQPTNLMKEPLKAERVQEELRQIEQTHGRLKAERVQDLLKAGWRLVHGGRAVQRFLELPTARMAANYATYVVELAAALGLPHQVRISERRVSVILPVLARRTTLHGLTDAMLGFAGLIG